MHKVFVKCKSQLFQFIESSLIYSCWLDIIEKCCINSSFIYWTSDKIWLIQIVIKILEVKVLGMIICVYVKKKKKSNLQSNS